MQLFWEGPLLGPDLLDRANRELIRGAMERGHELVIFQSGGFEPGNNSIVNWKQWITNSYFPSQVHVRHGWVPFWGNQVGPLVVYQPLEYRTVASSWIDWFRLRTELIVVTTEDDKDAFQRHNIPEERLAVIPPGVNPKVFCPQGSRVLQAAMRSFVFLWVGGLVGREGLDVLLRSYLRAFRRKDDVTLLLALIGRWRESIEHVLPLVLLQAMQDADAPHVLILNSALTDDQMADVYRSASVMVAPYRGTAFQTPVLEALSCGVPVLVSQDKPFIDLVPSNCGWYIPGRRVNVTPDWASVPGWVFETDTEGLTVLLRQVSAESGYGAKSHSYCREHVVNKWSWTEQWRKWETILAGIRQVGVKRQSPRDDRVVVWRGPLRNASGYASESRTFLKFIAQFGITPRAIDETSEPVTAPHSEDEELIRKWEHTPVSGTPLMVHNVIATRRPSGVDLLRTMFESDRVPEDWIPKIRAMDGLLVPCSFNVETFARCGVPLDKIHIVPSPIDTDRFLPERIPRGEPIRFISVFDWADRKGWDILIRAWSKAFSLQDPVVLIIKTTTITRPDARPRHLVRTLLEGVSGTGGRCAPVHVVEEVWDEDKLIKFYQAADVFVLPTRGEGWGRPIMEAMACGLPVIATNWSGPRDYLTEKNSLPLRIKGFEEAGELWFKGGYWASPDLDHLVYLMRYVVENFQEVRELGRQARITAEQYHPRVVTETLVQVLNSYGL